MCAVSSGIFYDLTARYALDWGAAHWAARVVAQTPNASVPVRGLRARVPIFLLRARDVPPGPVLEAVLPALLVFGGASGVRGERDAVAVDVRQLYDAVRAAAYGPDDPWTVRRFALHLLDSLWVALAASRVAALPDDATHAAWVRDCATMSLYLFPALRVGPRPCRSTLEHAVRDRRQRALARALERLLRPQQQPGPGFDWALEADDEETDARLLPVALVGTAALAPFIAVNNKLLAATTKRGRRGKTAD